MRIPDTTYKRLREAYLMMAQRARYRPAAPSDGCGHIELSRAEVGDLQRLAREAGAYAQQFRKEEDQLKFWIGCSNFKTNRAFVWTIEAARCLAGGGDETAIVLLEMALAELKSIKAGQRGPLSAA